MSDISSKNSDPAPVQIGRYPEAAVVSHLKACQAIGAEHARPLVDDFLEALSEKLSDFADKAKSNEEVRQLQETVRLLRRSAAELNKHFVACLSDGFVRFKNKQLNTRTGEEKYRDDMLTLVDDEDLEETIALASIASRADEQFGEVLWFLHQRLAVLNQGDKVQESNNPVSPIQFCEALRKSLAPLALNTKTKIIAYKVFEGELTQSLGPILEKINQYLAARDILPNLRFSGVSSAVFGSKRRQADEQVVDQVREEMVPDLTRAEDEPPQAGLFQAIRTLQQHIADAGQRPAIASVHASAQTSSPAFASSPGSAAPPGGPLGAQAVYSNQQLVTALQALQSDALSLTASAVKLPAEGQAIPALPLQNVHLVGQQLAEQLKEQSPNGQVDPTDMQTIDLVGMLFEYMLSDEQLPDSVKALLSYLHTPFLKMAFIDSTFFEKAEHPARLLLNSLAEAGTRWVSNDGTSQYDIFPKIKQTVSRVLEDFENDVRLFAELLLEFSAHVKKIGRRQDLVEKRAMEKVQGEEKLREVKLRVNREIRSRTDGKDLPSAVLLLLLQPWSDYLAFILLRYGDNSESWKKALRAVDDIFWSIEAPEEHADKESRLEKLDNLLDIIESGFETIGYDQSKGKRLIEALLSLQKMAIQSRKPAPAPAPIRSKLESEAAEKAGGDQELTEAITPEEQKMVESLKMIEFGTWFEFEGGKRLKVAWYNSKTMQYMLVDQMGKKVAMKSGLELARGMLVGKARVIAGSTKPFFERALENILQNLNAKAEAIQPEVSDA